MGVLNSAKSDEKEFCRYCREGMLFAVQEWIRAGKPVPAGRTVPESPLVLAAGKGFHSLVVLLLEQGLGQSQDHLDAALAAAGAGGHLETCRLLLDRGAGIPCVRAVDVVECGNPEVVALLLSAGMDIETGNPLAHALVQETRNALTLFRELRRKSKSVRQQGAVALKHCVAEDYLWRVTRLKRAGANPRLEVPSLCPRSKHDYPTSAMYEAVLSGSFRMVLTMGVRKTDKIRELIDTATIKMDKAVILHLLSRGGWRINDQPNGGSSLFQSCLRHLGDGGYFKMLFMTDRANSAWEVAQELLKRGARWKPDRGDLRDIRYYIRFGSQGRCVDLARLLVESKGASRETVAALFGTPMIRRWMGNEMEKIRAVLGK